MDRTKFWELRNNVLDKFNNLETGINLVISYFYFKEPNKDFIFRVLHNSYFPTVLRIELFTKMIKDSDKKRLNRVISKLKEMSKIRNYFAHITPSYFSGEEPSVEKVGWSPHPEDPKKILDFEVAHERFFELEKDVNPYVFNACKVLGVEFPVKL
ncbi:MAG: hypothetical protein Q8P79_03235 [Nanoarchaeota archaeon]|nr:hypothetical protein [Nanoarchaeota archaeon]